jgi:hypothetical protein
MTAETFEPRWLAGHDLIYVRLHGIPNGHAWYNDRTAVALTAAQVLTADLVGAVVVVANCYGDRGPMVQALDAAGAAAVIAGPGSNYAASNRVVGADLLVRWVILGMQMGLDVERALRLARMRVRVSSWRASDRDAAGFTIVRRGHERERESI